MISEHSGARAHSAAVVTKMGYPRAAVPGPVEAGHGPAVVHLVAVLSGVLGQPQTFSDSHLAACGPISRRTESVAETRAVVHRQDIPIRKTVKNRTYSGRLAQALIARRAHGVDRLLLANGSPSF